jgi:hypothetical protein
MRTRGVPARTSIPATYKKLMILYGFDRPRRTRCVPDAYQMRTRGVPEAYQRRTRGVPEVPGIDLCF